MKNVLVVAAHPDDEVLGCGGTISKYAKMGFKVHCFILGRGKSSRDGENVQMEQESLMKEAQESASILGISKISFGDFPDQKYDTVPLLDIIKAIEKIKNEVKPEIVFTHSNTDLNLDHQIVSRAVLTACRPVQGETVKEIYFFETLSSTEWGTMPFFPNVFIDITETVNDKLRAMEAYKSEIREFPHPRSGIGIETLAKLRGSKSGLMMAEAFQLVREIK